MASTVNKGNQKNGRSLSSIAKWAVIGVVMLIFLFLFRGELSRLLDRATGVKLSPTGIEIKTADTPLGKTVVSGTSIKSSGDLIEGIRGTNYVNKQYKFQISWPNSVNWSASDTYGEALHQKLGLPPTIEIPIVIMRNEMVGNFRPNVNVLVESVGNMSIRQYIELSVQSMQQRGWIIFSSSVDEVTEGGLLVFLNTSFENDLYQFQRIIIASGRAYVITASQLPPDNLLSQQLREELRDILNSFRLIT